MSTTTTPVVDTDTRTIADRRRDELPGLEAAGYPVYVAQGGTYWVLGKVKFRPDTGEWINERTDASGTLPDDKPVLWLFKRLLPQTLPPEDRILAILEACAVETRPCLKCGARLYFLVHPGSGKKTPYSALGISHFIDCTGPEAFSGRSAKK